MTSADITDLEYFSNMNKIKGFLRFRPLRPSFPLFSSLYRGFGASRKAIHNTFEQPLRGKKKELSV